MKKYDLVDKIHASKKYLEVSEIALENKDIFPNGESVAALLGEIQRSLDECIDAIETEGIDGE